MTIDWTLPVETTEDPPRHVRVLATDINNALSYAVVLVRDADGTEWSLQVDAEGRDVGDTHLRLRNAPPPKPEPVRYEAWVNLYDNGHASSWPAPHKADGITREGRVECRRITWMSDGSPVPSEASGEDTGCGLLRHVDDNGREDGHTLTMVSGGADYIGDFDTGFPRSLELCRMHDHNQTMVYVAAADRDHWKAKAEALQAEVDRMKPVVDSAVAWASQDQLGRLSRVRKAVRAYQTHRHPAEPAKNCAMCKHFNPRRGCYRACGSGLDLWEPRHD